MSDFYLQYGCGLCAPSDWLNFDASPTLRYERLPLIGRLYTRNQVRFPTNVRYGNVVKGLPVADASCVAIYCSHVLEHLTYDECLVALTNTFSYLKPGGIFRMVLPDLERLARLYLEDKSPQASYWFMHHSGLGLKSRSHGLRSLIEDWLGNSKHLWLWDERGLGKVLKDLGFQNIRRAQFGDSETKKFAEVEDPARFEGALAMQCKK